MLWIAVRMNKETMTASWKMTMKSGQNDFEMWKFTTSQDQCFQTVLMWKLLLQWLDIVRNTNNYARWKMDQKGICQRRCRIHPLNNKWERRLFMGAKHVMFTCAWMDATSLIIGNKIIDNKVHKLQIIHC
jgi:hypothetical protein